MTVLLEGCRDHAIGNLKMNPALTVIDWPNCGVYHQCNDKGNPMVTTQKDMTHVINTLSHEFVEWPAKV